MFMYKVGMQGQAVRDIQTVLRSADLYDGKIDGAFGRKTQRAVQDWQSIVGAKQDGMWGPQTLQQSLDYLARFNDMDAFSSGADLVVPSMKGAIYG